MDNDNQNQFGSTDLQAQPQAETPVFEQPHDQPPSEEHAQVAQNIVDSSSVDKWDKSQQFLEKIEQKTNSRVIVIYISGRTSLAEPDVYQINQQLQEFGHVPRISVLLSGPGGSGIAAARIATILRYYCDQLDFLIPQDAASACTMLALAGDNVLMSPVARLSPIDSSMAGNPLAPTDKDGYPVRIEVTQIQKFIELCNSGMSSKEVDDIKKSPYALLAEHVHPLVIGSIQRILTLSKLLTTDILKLHLNDPERIEAIVNSLNDDFPTHGYPITLSKAKEIGIQALPMDEELSKLTLDYHDILQLISKENSNEQGGVKVSYRVDAIFESKNARTVFFQERNLRLGEKGWQNTGSKADYKTYKPVDNGNGLTRIQEVKAE